MSAYVGSSKNLKDLKGTAKQVPTKGAEKGAGKGAGRGVHKGVGKGARKQISLGSTGVPRLQENATP